jgi:hypothetical protein
MGSAFEAHFGLNQDQVEKLMKVDPDMGDSPSLFAKKILIKYAEGELIPKTNATSDPKLPANNLKDQLIKRRIEDIELNIKLKKLDLQTKLVHVWKVSPSMAVEISSGRTTLEEARVIPDNSTKENFTYADKVEKEPMSFFDESENRFICLECKTHPQVRFSFRYGIVDEITKAMQDYEQHVLDIHHRALNSHESSIMNDYCDNLSKRIVKP